MVMLESPTNPRLQITDIRAISDMAGGCTSSIQLDP
jgi:cystathionine beta-lyase/cystathionine gamma-synthase